MKTKLLLIAVACLLLISVKGYAQPLDDIIRMQNSPVGQQALKEGFKEQLHAFWDGHGINFWIAHVLLNTDPDLRAAWDVSDEQLRHIRAGIQTGTNNMLNENPDVRELLNEMQEFRRSGVLYAEDADKETIARIQEITAKVPRIMSNAAADGVNDVLTPEQKQKIKESLLANMGEMPVLSPGMFEALDLTDAQKQQMEAIKKRLEPEFEKTLESFASGELILIGKVVDEMKKEGKYGISPGEDEPTRRKLIAEDPECKRISEEIRSHNQEFAEKFKIQMFDVLTDAQWARLLALVDHPPAYAQALGRKMRSMRGENEQAEPGEWVPGPGSWRPGDPIPMQYRIERETRRGFPRGEN